MQDHGRVARRIDRRQRVLASVVFEDVARQHVRRGHSGEMIVRNCALGADDLHRRLRKRGVHASPNTIRADLGAWQGQLGYWTDPDEPGPQVIKKGAHTFDLVELANHFGAYAQRLLDDLFAWAIAREILPTDGALSSTSNRRARGYLKWAIEHAREGARNVIGNRLAWACATTFGLDQGETMAVLVEYQTRVDKGRRSYGPREARATVLSVYRRASR